MMLALFDFGGLKKLKIGGKVSDADDSVVVDVVLYGFDFVLFTSSLYIAFFSSTTSHITPPSAARRQVN